MAGSAQPPPSEPPPPAEPSVEGVDVEHRCPYCGQPHEPYQEYCLECGRRLVPLPDVYVRSDLWARDSPIWLWAALAALLLVALAAGAIVAVAATRDEEPQGSPIVTTGPGGTDTIGTIETAPTLTLSTNPNTVTIGTTTLPTTTTVPTTTTTTTTPGTIMDWPAGRDGYTVVLRSTPTSEGRTEADAAAQRALNAGLRPVGVLNSSNFSSLRPGYYATFTGIYSTENEAENALPRARQSGFPLAYVRRVAD